MIVVENWYCRLGNNIVQIRNVITMAFYYKHNVLFKKKHPFFDLSIIENYFKQYENPEIITDKKENFFRNQLSDDVYMKYKKKCSDLLKQAFIIKNVDKLNNADIVVHIRSGDIFTHRKPHPKYVPAPLSYYVDILNSNEYNKIIIVCEDAINPVVGGLLKLYKNAQHTINPLHRDIEIILGATNIVSSIGTFVPSLLMMSDNIKNHYEFDYTGKYSHYYSKMTPWVNSEEQRRNIMTYILK